MIKGVVESIDYKKNEVTIKRHGYDSCNNCKIGCASRPPESENIFKARLIPGLKTGDKITLDITPEKKYCVFTDILNSCYITFCRFFYWKYNSSQ